MWVTQIMTLTLAILISMVLVWPIEAIAYIGPGMGAGVIATALGFVGAILLGLFAVLYYPIKRMMKGKNREQNESVKKEKNKPEEEPTEN